MIISLNKDDNLTDKLEEALKRYQDPEWLGRYSPLATPYFLGDRLPASTTKALDYGRGLQKLLNRAINHFSGKYAARYHTIIREYYIHNRSVAAASDLVGLTKNSFHLNRKAAIIALEEIVVELVRPALRLEQPPICDNLFGRGRLIDKCFAQLQRGQSIMVVGVPGIGKTAFAATLNQKWGQLAFWYTIRPGLNDQLESLVFAIALFAQRHNSSVLWLELLSDPHRNIDERLLSTIRYTITQIESIPLFCFDGVEFLEPATIHSHKLLLSFVDSLRTLVPILLTGVELITDVDECVTLTGLSASETTQLLLAHQIDIPSKQLSEIHTYTQGNPRLLKLCAAALLSGEKVEQIQEILSNSSLVNILFRHTMQQLSEEMRLQLTALCVFRSPISIQYWSIQNPTADFPRLIAYGLVQIDSSRSIELPIVYRQLIYAALEEETRILLHQQAAALRSQTGAYTSVAHHLCKARQPEKALSIWREHQTQEIAQGQAVNALTLFRSIMDKAPNDAVRDQVLLICAQLENFGGQGKQAVSTLNKVSTTDSILAIEAEELRGTIANDLSDFEGADEAFNRALTIAEQFVEVHIARVYKGRAWMHLRQREIAHAERELAYAHYEVENMYGNLELDRCEYGAARAHYTAALQLAEELEHIEAIGKTCNNLAGVALFEGNFAEAIDFSNQAAAAYRRIGKIGSMIGCMITLAVIYNQAGEQTDALTVLNQVEELSIQQHEQTKWQQALLAQARAEAYIGMGELVTAEEHVRAVIAAEEISLLPDAYRVYGEICLQRHEFSTSEALLRRSLAFAEQNEDLLLTAYAWRSLAYLYRVQGITEAMSKASFQAIKHFETLGLAHEVKATTSLLQSSVEAISKNSLSDSKQI